MIGSWRPRSNRREAREAARLGRPRRDSSQVAALVAYLAVGGSMSEGAARLHLSPSTVKRHLADLRARYGLTTEQQIYQGRAKGRLMVPSLELR